MKNNISTNGFTFVEVMIALLVAGLMLSGFFLLVNQVFRQSITQNSTLYHVYQLKLFHDQEILNNMQKKDAKEVGKKHIQANAENKIESELIKLEKGSVLAEMPHLYKHRTSIEWHHLQTPMKETIVSFVWMPEQKK